MQNWFKFSLNVKILLEKRTFNTRLEIKKSMIILSNNFLNVSMLINSKDQKMIPFIQTEAFCEVNSNPQEQQAGLHQID